MLQPYRVIMPVYAESQQEADELQAALNDFVMEKYRQQIYPRAATLTSIVKRYGGSSLVDNFIR